LLHFLLSFSSLFLFQSATDFTNALKLDPTNRDLPNLLQKSKDKYLEVEGRGEWKESVGADTAQCEDAVCTVVPTFCESKKDFLALLDGDMGEVLAEGSCVYREVPANCSSEAAFTRVAITFDDDDDDDDEGEGEVKAEVRGGDSSSRTSVTESSSSSSNNISSSSSSSSSGGARKVDAKEVGKEKEEEASFTRIQITDDDDDSEGEGEGEGSSGIEKQTDASSAAKEEKEKDVVKRSDTASASSTGAAAAAAAFTRISITDEDDEDAEEGDTVQIGKEEVVASDKAAVTSATGGRVIDRASTVPSSSSSSSSSSVITPSLKKESEQAQSSVPHTTTTTSSSGSSSGSAGEPNSESLKIAGNEEMKNCNYPAALSLYTASLELDQSNLLTRNNRSQVYLKLNQYQNAVDDATFVILNDPSHPRVLGPTFVPSSVSPAVKKALFRRATVSETANLPVCAAVLCCAVLCCGCD
jgi:tetratricopeptide (TPR) repeat protein